MPLPPRVVLSVRVTEDTKRHLDERAAREGTTTSRLAAQLLDLPSFSDALTTVESTVDTEDGRAYVAGLASQPRLLDTTAARLRAVAAGLNALAARWPR